MSKRICYISPWSIHSYRWMEAFFQKGYHLSLITDLSAWIAPKPPPIPVHVLPTLDRYNLEQLAPNSLRITKILREINPDFVHLHVYPHYGLLARLNRVPFILTSWGLEVLLLYRMNFIHKTVSKKVAQSARKITVDAECMKKIWMTAGIPENKIEVIPFGVDTSIFNPHADPSGVRRRLDIEEDCVVVISTRPLYNHHYNVECLIRAIPLVLKRNDKVRFIVKGVGPLEDYLKELARELHVYDYVRFVGLMPYGEIARHLVASDVYVSTSFLDSTSVSLLEAMACGLPPVTTDIAGNREWIKNGVNGLLYPPKDHKSLAENILRLVEDKAMRNRLGETSRGIIAEKAVWERCVARMEAVYEELL